MTQSPSWFSFLARSYYYYYFFFFPPLEWIYELLEAILSMGFFSVIVLNPSFKCLSELPSDHLINAAGPVG